VTPSPGNVTVKNFYTAAGCQHSLFKRGASWRSHRIRKLPDKNHVKPEKRKYVMRLLEAIGQVQNEQVMSFYRVSHKKVYFLFSYSTKVFKIKH